MCRKEQQSCSLNDIVKAMCSEYGAERAATIAKETGDNLRFLTFFGEPSATTPFAWRIGMHHLTLIFDHDGR